MLKIDRNKIKQYLEFILVFWLIICSGTQHFYIFNTSITMIVLLVLGILYFLLYPKIYMNTFKSFLLILGVISVNAFIHLENFNSLNTLIIILINLIVLLVLHSNINKQNFLKYFIYVMTIEALISLLCFTYIAIFRDVTLPFQYEQTVFYSRNSYNIIYLTFYYTLGWLSTGGYFFRNAGFFWEPGAHQIFLNLALIYVFNGSVDHLNKKVKKFIILVLSLGVISTQSTTGYLCLLLIACFVMMKTQESKKALLNIGILSFGAIGAVILIGVYTDTFDKIIYGTGSFNTRIKDTVSGFIISLKSPFIGLGLFTDKSTYYLKYHITNMSNGLLSLSVSIGYPFLFFYLYRLFANMKKIFNLNYMQTSIIFLIYGICIFSENIATYPVFLSLLFTWKDSK